MTSSDGLHRPKCVGRRSTRLVALKAVVALLLLMAPPIPTAEALKLSSTKDDRENLGMGLLRAVEVVRGRFERAWALVSAPEPSPADLDTALELLQANAKQWESLEPAVTLWTERENAEAAQSTTKMNGFEAQERVGHRQEHRARGKSRSLPLDATRPAEDNHGPESGEGMGQYSSPETASRIYEEAASLLAHNRAVLGQALARSGHMDLGIKHLEIACPEILEYQQNAQGHRNSKSWLDCYANLVQMYKTQKRFDEAAELMAKMPWLPVQDEVASSSSLTNIPALSSRDEGSVPVPELDENEAVGVERCGEAGADVGASDATGVVSSEEIVGVRGVVASRGGSRGDDNRGDSGTNDEHQASGGGEGVPVGQGGSSASSKAGRGEKGENSGDSEEGVGGNGNDISCDGCNTVRPDAPPARGAVAARVAGVSKPAAGGSSSASAESSITPSASETGSESHARESVEVHAEAMRALMNEVAGELAVSTATRSTMGEEWLAARVGDAEAILASVRAGLLPASSSPPEAGSGAGAEKAAAGVSPLAVGVPGHADIVREASHYLSAIKVRLLMQEIPRPFEGVAAQGWSYVDNEIQRMERHPGPTAKPGFQSRREVIHTFRYLLMKARQFASENQSHVPGTPPADSKWPRGTGRKPRATSGKAKDAKARNPKKRAGSPGRSKAPRREADHAEGDNHGLYTLLVGAFLAVLATAFSSGRSGGAERRREAVRQRAATRAARTAGSYVEPSQRGLLMSLVLRSWNNLRRSWVVVSIRVRSNASVVRSTFVTVGVGLVMRLRNALDLHLLSYGIRVIGNLGRSAEREAGRSVVVSRKGASSNTPLQRQRSRKQVKKALAQSVARRRTEAGSRSASPCELAGKVTTTTTTKQAAADAAAGPGCCRVGVEGQEIRETANFLRGGNLAEPSKSKHGDSKSNSSDVEEPTELPIHTAAFRTSSEEGTMLGRTGREPEFVGGQETSVVGAVRIAPTSGSSIDEVRKTEVSSFSTVAVAAAAALAGTPDVEGSVASLPGMITADQVKAIVEEDELAWEQAKQADRGQDRSKQRMAKNERALPSSAGFSERKTVSPARNATLARQTLSGFSGKGDDGYRGTSAEVSERNELSHEREEGGWSEVVSGGSRWRTHVSVSGQGNRRGGGPALLSIRNIRDATRPARSSSPGSDPATTTSASSSDCSDGSKEHMMRPEPTRGASQRNGSKQHQQTPQAGKANDGASSHMMKHLSATWNTQSVSRMKGVVGGSSRASKPPSEQGRGLNASRVQKWNSDTKFSRPSRSAQAAWPDGNSTGAYPYMRSPRVGRNGRLSSLHSSHRTAAAGTGVRVDGRSAGGHSGASVHETTPKGIPRAGGHRPGRSLPVFPSVVHQGQKRVPDVLEQPRVHDGKTTAPSACPRPGPPKPTTAMCRDPAGREVANDNTEGAKVVGGDGTDMCGDAAGGASLSSRAVMSMGSSYDKQPPEDEVYEKAPGGDEAYQSDELCEGPSPAGSHEGIAPGKVVVSAMTCTGDDQETDASSTPMTSRPPEGNFSQAAETHPHVSPVTCAAVNDCCTGSVHQSGESMSSIVYHQPVLVSGISSMTAPVSDGDDEVIASGVYGHVPNVSYEGSQDSVGSAAAHPGERDGFSPEFTPALAAPVPQPPHLLVLAPARSHDQYPRLAGVPPQHQQQPPPPPPPPIQDPTGMPAMYCHMSHQPAPRQGVYYPPGPAMMGGGMGLISRGISNSGGLEPVLGALCWQVEYYFSVENLMRDVYLRSLMDSEGFVDVSKIMVFNRVRKMTSDISVLVAAMRRSTRLEVREQENTGEVQVRTRHSPLHWISTQAVLPPPVSSDEPALDGQGYSIHTVASTGSATYEQRTEDVAGVECAELSGEYGVGQYDAMYADERQQPIAFEAQGQGMESPQAEMVTAG